MREMRTTQYYMGHTQCQIHSRWRSAESSEGGANKRQSIPHTATELWGTAGSAAHNTERVARRGKSPSSPSRTSRCVPRMRVQQLGWRGSERMSNGAATAHSVGVMHRDVL